MGLAPYGNPIFEEKIKKLIDIKEDGTFRLNQKYFNYTTGLTMTNDHFHNLFGQKPRAPKNEKLKGTGSRFDTPFSPDGFVSFFRLLLSACSIFRILFSFFKLSRIHVISDLD